MTTPKERWDSADPGTYFLTRWKSQTEDEPDVVWRTWDSSFDGDYRGMVQDLDWDEVISITRITLEEN